MHSLNDDFYVLTGKNAVIAECVSRIMRYVFNERK